VKELTFHPVAEMFPLMQGAEFDDLVEDIKKHGQHHKILVAGRQIIDGRNRYRACLMLKRKPLLEEWDGKGSLTELSCSLNFHRRHLTQSQRAATGAIAEEEFAKEARDRMSTGGGDKKSGLAKLPNPMPEGGWPKKISGKSRAQHHAILNQLGPKELERRRDLHAPLCDAESPRLFKIAAILDRMFGPIDKDVVHARDLAAKACGVSSRYIGDAKLVRQHDAKLFDQVIAGSVTIAKAARAVHRARRRDALGISKPVASLPQKCIIELGDCLEIMPTMPRGKARLGFADPPYNIGFDYGKGAKRDLLPIKEYRRWCSDWLEKLVELLTPDGSIWILISYEHVAHIFATLEELGLHFRDWITWYEKFGTNCSDKCNRTARPLLHFTRSRTDFIFDRRAMNTPSARQSVYGDKRAVARGKNHDDVWDIPRLADNHPERLPDAKTQLPMELLRRVIGSATEPGDLVVDPFTGSGTTPAVCLELGRAFHGIELEKQSVKLATARLARQSEGNPKGAAK
jgi:DNA modification methylase